MIVVGRDGWKSIQKRIPLRSLERVYIGEAYFLEKLSSYSFVQDQVASRVTFYLKEESLLKLDFAMKVFDHDSLLELFKFLNKNGIKTNINDNPDSES